LKLISEPAAAATFFCHSYSLKYKKEYKGFIVVVDFGGGTLDVTLCEASGDKNAELGTPDIKEHRTFGDEDVSSLGHAGVAFDNAVITKLLIDNGLPLLEANDEDFIELRSKFEKLKIEQHDEIKKQMTIYYEEFGPDVLKDETLFELKYNKEKLIVRCEDLVFCFNEVNRCVLLDTLREAQQFFGSYEGIDIASQDNFRVLLVGGFSNFYSVEHEVKTFFSGISNVSDDKFENLFPTMNRSFAISRGAALIAEGIRTASQTCPYEIGYVVYGTRYNGVTDVEVPRYIPVIQMGDKYSELKPVEWSDWSSITMDQGMDHSKTYFRIYFNDGRSNDRGLRVFRLGDPIKSQFPNIDKSNNAYRIGISMKNMIPFLCIEDKNSEIWETSLFKLYEKLSIDEEGE